MMYQIFLLHTFSRRIKQLKRAQTQKGALDILFSIKSLLILGCLHKTMSLQATMHNTALKNISIIFVMIFWAEFILMHKANSLVFEHLTIDFFYEN